MERSLFATQVRGQPLAGSIPVSSAAAGVV